MPRLPATALLTGLLLACWTPTADAAPRCRVVGPPPGAAAPRVATPPVGTFRVAVPRVVCRGGGGNTGAGGLQGSGGGAAQGPQPVDGGGLAFTGLPLDLLLLLGGGLAGGGGLLLLAGRRPAVRPA